MQDLLQLFLVMDRKDKTCRRMQMSKGRSNWVYNLNYGGIQGFYWMMFCSVIGYLSAYLLDKGFNNSQIGAILAVSNILAVIIQPVIADFADRQKKIGLNKIVGLFLIFIFGLSFSLYFISNHRLLLSVAVTLIVTVVVVLHPLVNSLSFLYEKSGVGINFGVARGMGSVSYALLSIVIGTVIERYGSGILSIFYTFTIGGALLLVILYKKPKNGDSFEFIEDRSKKHTAKNKSGLLGFAARYGKFMIFLCGATLVLFDHSMINNFCAQIVYNIGGNDAQMGRAISLAAIMELPMMLAFYKVKNKINCGTLLKVSGVFFTVKHILTYLASTMTLLYIAQFFQVVAFGLFIPASVYYVKQMMAEEDVTKGQAFITIAITLGAIFSSIIGGKILDLYGAGSMLFVGAIVSLVGSVIMFVFCEQVPKEA